ncbi:MAG: nitrite/sulfite reductase, partial [Methylococcales bacterium]|nr:nitrite/sulfite reductase [Methylococcales bacterium]
RARIKILVRESGIEKVRELVEAEWLRIKNGMEISNETYNAMIAQFSPPLYNSIAAEDQSFEKLQQQSPAFATWITHNTTTHRVEGYKAVFISLKAPDSPPGDITDNQLEAVADLADQYSFGEIRATHRQNLVLADIEQVNLYPLWQKLCALQLATPNIGTVTDIICCPGLDFCALANAGSIDVTKEINQALDDMDYIHDLGDLKVNISGCMNGCAHQSVGHIGILGVDKKGTEWYQLTLGGSSENEAAIGQRLGAAIAKNKIVKAITEILEIYIKFRENEQESFLTVVNRIGILPFKEKVYANH